MMIIGGFNVLCELPPGDWWIATYGDYLLAICPEHEPRMIAKDGTVVIVKVPNPSVFEGE